MKPRINVTVPLVVSLFVSSSFAESIDYGARIKVNTLWRVHQSASDLMTTPSLQEEQRFLNDSQQVFYVPGESIAGTAPLYRLINAPSCSDHMDSSQPGEPNYVVEGAIGYPWTAGAISQGVAPPGLSPIYRSLNSSTGDHGILSPRDVLPQSYQNEGSLGLYGYQRYGNVDKVLSCGSAGGVTACSNLAAGGAVWSWTWNGTQFINDYDYGREMASYLYLLEHETLVDGVGWQCGRSGEGTKQPAEPGTFRSTPDIPAQERRGSPLVAYGNSPIVNGQLLHQTITVPLDWAPHEWEVRPPGLTDEEWIAQWQDVAVLWSGLRLGKNLILNWQLPGTSARNWAVARYEAIANFSNGANADYHCFVAEAPAIFLWGNFNVYYQYNFADGSRTPLNVIHAVPGSDNTLGISTTQSEPRLAVIVSDSNTSSGNAMAVFIDNAVISGIGLLNSTLPSDSGQYRSSFSKVFVRYDGPLVNGRFRYKSWIMTGNLGSQGDSFSQGSRSVMAYLNEFRNFTNSNPNTLKSVE